MTDPAASPAPPELPLTSEEKTWMTLVHLSALSGYFIPFGNIVGPLILWNIQKQKYTRVDSHGKRAINFQISMMIWIFCAIPLCFVCIGYPILIGLLLTNIVCIIIAAVKASAGESFEYPLAISFIK